MLGQSQYHRSLSWFSLPRGNVDAAAAVLLAILVVTLPEDWLSGSFRMRPRSLPVLFILA